MRNKYPEAIQRWKNRPGMVIVRVRPTFVVTGRSFNDHIYIDFLDLEHETAVFHRTIDLSALNPFFALTVG
jgi:hypothetical protein